MSGSKTARRSWPVRFFGTTWHFTRFLLDGSRPDRFALLGDYLRIQFWRIASPTHRRPIKLLGFRVSYPSVEFLRHLYNELVLEEAYPFRFEGDAPRIIDAGANIGLATLALLRKYPAAKITAFEPDPATFAVLKENVEQNGLANVDIHNVALAPKAGTLTLYAGDLRSGDSVQSVSREFRAAVTGRKKLAKTKVKAETLGPYLKEKIDLLKIDIEGAEGPVLRNVASRLGNVRQIMMEYHYDKANTRLEEVLKILERAGHRYRVISHREPVTNEPGSVAMIFTEKR